MQRLAAALVSSIVFVVTLRHVSSFNIDVESYTRYRGDPNTESMFGFSVSLHRENGASWVLVGAPKAETPQPGVTKGGAVYACDISRPNCTQVPFDPNGPNKTPDGDQIDEKSFQWFGASVYSAGEDGPVVACAPMYVFFSTVNRSRRDPVGTCFLARNKLREFSEYSPCRTRNWGHHKQGSCQAGLGVSISRDGERLFVGAVGSRYWQGELYSINDRASLLFVPPSYTILIEGMLISQSTYARPDVISTPEGPEKEDDTYLGYSMTVGDFGGTVPGHEDVAVGRPKGAGLVGQVSLYTWNMTSIQNITGEQLGSYFGYSMATSDVDGDGRDDLIIGAPLYTDPNNEGKYETGRVYIIYQGTQTVRFNQLHIKDGKNSKGRFGLALTSLGDVNKDGFGDFAVGAPYDGPEERGAVYIFHGSATGVRDSQSQVIYAEDIVGSPYTFGFSVSGGIDLDENDYPDLVIGAYESNTAVFLRARPVVKVEATMNFLSDGKQIALEERNCTLRDRTKVPCMQVKSCLLYNGIGVENRLDFEVQFVLDAKKTKSPRMFFLTDENRSVMNQSLRLNKGQQTCKEMTVYLKPNIRDKLTSLEAEIRYSLLSNFSSRRVHRQLSPILDLNEELSRKDSITIRKNCGKDNICIPDLRLIAQPSVKRYLLGSGERFHLNVMVQNEGEDAFEAVFETTVPPGMNYVKIERLDDAEREIPVQCSPPSFLNNNTLHCDIGNPLPREKLVQFKVILQPFHQDGMKPRYEFEMNVNSTNPENSSSITDNIKNITVPIWVETDLILQGSSHPADVHYNSSLYYKTDNFTHESDIGPQVIHVYGIRNKGPSDIVEAEAYFLWPSYTLAGDHLLYLLDQPETMGNVRCEYVEETNVEHLILDRKRKGFLDDHGDIGVQAGLTKSESSESSSSSSHSSSSSSSSSSSGTYHSESHSSSTFSQSSSGRTLTEEERRRLEEAEMKREQEESLKESGDSSVRHRNRNKFTEEHSHYSSNGGRLESDSHSRPVYIPERGRVEVSKTQEGSESRFSEHSDHNRHSGNNRGGTGSAGRGHGGRGHVHYEEREHTSNTTWHSGETPKTVTRTKWTTIDDGVKKSGDSTDVQSGVNINLANLGLSSAGNRRYTIGSGGGARVYSEERHYEKNTTWNSGGVPKVSESSSWKTNEDGVVKTGGFQTGSENRQAIGGVAAGTYESRSRTSGTVEGSGQTFQHGYRRQGTSESHQTRGRNEGGYSSTNSRINNSSINVDQGLSTGRQGTSTYSSGGGHHGSMGSEHRVSSGTSETRVHEEEVNYGGRRTSQGQNVDYDREYRNRQDAHHNQGSNTGSGYRTTLGGQHGSVGSEHRVSSGTSETRVHEEEVNYGGRRTYSQGQNVDNDRENRNRQGSHHNQGSNVGSVHRTTSISRAPEEEGSTRVHTQGEQFGYDREHRHREEGTANREIVAGSHADNGVRRNEGRHKIHWSSEHGSDSRTNYEEEENRGMAKVEGDIRHIVASGINAQGANNRAKTYEEERHHEWNTTWTSGSKPKTTEHTRWTFNEDGLVKNGSHTKTYEGTARIDKDLNKHVRVTNIDSGVANVDQNLVGTGVRGTTYAEEKVSSYNTTWNSATGGKPITTSHTAWKVNRDGVVSSGSKSDVFEGTPPPLQGVDDRVDAGRSYGARKEESSYESRLQENRETARIDSHTRGHSGHQNHYSGSQDHHHGSNREGASMTSNERRFEGSVTSSNADHNVKSEGSHHQSGATNINVGDLLKASQSSGSQASSFNHFGEIARGPQDGVAKTYTLDLGINSGSRAGSSSRHHGHTAQHSGSAGAESQGESARVSEERRSSFGASGSTKEASQGYSYRNQDRLESYGGGGRSSHSSWSQSSVVETADGDNPQHGGAYGVRKVSESAYPRHISDEATRGKFQLYPRYKRQTGEEDFEKSLNCGPTDCTRIKCTLGPLKKDEEAWVAFRSRVWVPTIKKLSTNVEVGLSSLVAARVTVLPHIGSPDVVTTHTHEIHSQIMPPETAVKPDIIPLWIVVVSACAGAIILMLLVYLLYKCGFFKRNRPSNAPEKQPLNRNGHYHGDEAL